MNTAFITNFCPFYRVKLYKILAEKIGAKFLFFSDASEKNWESLNPHGSDEVAVVPLRAGSDSKLKVMFNLAKELWSNDYDIFVQGVSGKFAVLISFIIAKLRGKPIILWTGFWNHPQTFFHKITFPLIRFFYKHSDAVVGYGTHVRDYLISIGVDKDKIFVAQNTADNELYNKEVKDSERNKLLRELSAENCKIALFVGRLQKEKGVDVLLQAINCKLQIDNCKLIIIGRGPEQENLKSYCEENKLENVLFLSYVYNADLYKYYNIADIVLVPSVTTRFFKEPWGLVVNEAMNQNCVLIASDAVGAAAGGLIENEKTGFIVPEKNPEKLADAISKVLESEELQIKISNAAREKIKNWTYDKMAQGFIDAVDSVFKN